MQHEKQGFRFLISGGGTGGHVYPALAIAEALKKLTPNSEFLFVGALGRMEMEKVPLAGFKIIGLDIMGIQRRFTWKNLLVPIKLINSRLNARKIVKDFKPHAAIGVGGYASYPTLNAANSAGVLTYLQEQNGYAGLTNKALAKNAKRIFVSYEGMERFFPKEKIHLTGNPLRNVLTQLTSKEEACSYFNLDAKKPVVLSIGGSLGAKTLNEGWKNHSQTLAQNNVQLIWQTGAKNFSNYNSFGNKENILCLPYLERMDLAYSAADVIVSRSGALSVSELCLVGKPVVFVPSPNVAEDHQTHNAKAIVKKDAALLLEDNAVNSLLAETVLNLVNNQNKRSLMGEAIKRLAKPNAAEEIANFILEDCRKEGKS